MSDIADVIITGEITKLPPEYAELLDPQLPLPAHVAFFEKRITAGQMIGTVVVATGLAMLGALATLFGAYYVLEQLRSPQMTSTDFVPLIFGLVCLFASWMMLQSLRLRRDMMIRQQKGEPTRLGIFLTPDSIFEVNEFGYCIVPRAHFRGLAGANVQYVQDGKEKSFRLPGELVTGDAAGMSIAIGQWANARSGSATL